MADDLTIELMEYVIRKKLQGKNIMVIMSYCDGECLVNKKFTQFIKNISQSGGVTNIFLKELSELETGKMIQNILSMPEIPYEFAGNIYEKTKGNPLFVQEIIKSFYNKKCIYVDKEEGYWAKDHDYSKFIVPSNMHQVLLDQVKEMGELNYSILKTISIFKSAVSLELIKSFVSGYSGDLNEVIGGLISSGILCKKLRIEGLYLISIINFLKVLCMKKLMKKTGRLCTN